MAIAATRLPRAARMIRFFIVTPSPPSPWGRCGRWTQAPTTHRSGDAIPVATGCQWSRRRCPPAEVKDTVQIAGGGRNPAYDADGPTGPLWILPAAETTTL